MAVTTVRIIGMADLQETLKQVLPREANNILRRTTYAVATTVRDRVRENAPVDRGDLKRSIKAKRDRGSKNVVSASVYADKSGGRSGKGIHWAFVEFGTQNMTAQPYIVPSVEQIRPQIDGIYRSQFGIQLEREMKKRNKQKLK